jgi:hypothetical protein
MSTPHADTTRAFHSSARVAFVKHLPCLACRTTAKPRENHHIRSGGKGRRSDYFAIVPLCHSCHELVHRIGATSMPRRFAVGRINAIDWQNEAFRTELLWQLHRRYRFDTMKRRPLPKVLSSFLDDTDVTVEWHGKQVFVHVADCRPLRESWPPLPDDGMDTVDWLDTYRTYQNAIMSAVMEDIDHPLAGTLHAFQYPPAATDFLQRLATDGLLRIPSIPPFPEGLTDD